MFSCVSKSAIKWKLSIIIGHLISLLSQKSCVGILSGVWWVFQRRIWCSWVRRESCVQICIVNSLACCNACYSCYTPCSIAYSHNIGVKINTLFGHEQRLRRWQSIVPTPVGILRIPFYVLGLMSRIPLGTAPGNYWWSTVYRFEIILSEGGCQWWVTLIRLAVTLLGWQWGSL